VPRFEIKVRTNARREEVTQHPGAPITVSVSVPPVEGKANKRVIELLAKAFRVPKSSIRIVRGKTSPRKVVEIS